jgi:hypothetical protein
MKTEISLEGIDAATKDLMLQRAISVICNEWGYTAESALEWIKDDPNGTFEEEEQEDERYGDGNG